MSEKKRICYHHRRQDRRDRAKVLMARPLVACEGCSQPTRSFTGLCHLCKARTR